MCLKGGGTSCGKMDAFFICILLLPNGDEGDGENPTDNIQLFMNLVAAMPGMAGMANANTHNTLQLYIDL